MAARFDHSEGLFTKMAYIDIKEISPIKFTKMVSKQV